jgi:type IV pilus assembly protein PilC
LRKSLQSIAFIVENSVYKQAIMQIRDYVSAGQTVSAAIDNSNLFPKRMVQMIAIGEESGLLENMLIKIAEHYESEVDYFIDNLNNLLEPMIMVILGGMIGGLLVAVYLPIFRLGTVI